MINSNSNLRVINELLIKNSWNLLYSRTPSPIKTMEPINYSFPTNLSLHEPGPYYITFLFDKLYSHLDHIHISWAPPKQSLQLKSLKDIWFWVYDIAQENMIFQISLLSSSPWDYASRKKRTYFARLQNELHECPICFDYTEIW